MFRGTQSIQVYMQQIGRALSTNGNVPMIFDFVDNIHSIKELEDIIRCESDKDYIDNEFIYIDGEKAYQIFDGYVEEYFDI